MSKDNGQSDKVQIKKGASRPKGFFRSLRELASETATYGANAVDGLIFEQRRSLLRDRLVGDAEFMRTLKEDMDEFGGLQGCKNAHNELVGLLEDLKL